MEGLSALAVPLLLGFVGVYGMARGVDVYAALTRGAEEGLGVLVRILPSLVALLSAVSMLRASGAPDALARLLAPLLSAVGIPAECAPLLLVRPISGSAALAVCGELIGRCGADSYAGRVAAVMLGSSETTFYALAVYCGAAGVTRTRYILPAALLADAVMFVGSAWAVRMVFGA